MLTDIFATRYSDRPIWAAVGEPERVLLVQGFRLVAEQLMPYWKDGKVDDGSKKRWDSVESRLSMELGRENLSPHSGGFYDKNNVFQYLQFTKDAVCKKWMLEEYEAGTNPDRYIKERISLIELAFRDQLDIVTRENSAYKSFKPVIPHKGFHEISKFVAQSMHANNATMNSVYARNCDELNERFRRAKAPLNYHNGFIQIVTDEITQAQIAQPFWKLVASAKWQNVSIDMAEAVDRRDTGGRDPAFYAGKALESVIKIISDEKGRTTGNEKGAANYIDNLVSQSNGRFIDVWEADALKHYFGKLRNPMGHGPGNAPMIALTPQQTDWAIETAMSWCKSLIER